MIIAIKKAIKLIKPDFVSGIGKENASKGSKLLYANLSYTRGKSQPYACISVSSEVETQERSPS